MSRIVKCTPYELEYIDPVMGQLSDGMWENSSKMQAYWICNSITDAGIEMEQYNNTFGRRSYWNPLFDKTDAEVRIWFANKLKAVVKEWLKDNGYKAEDWNRVNDAEVDYLRDGQTVAGAYKAYDSLKGRESKEGKVVRVTVTKAAIDIAVDDLIGKRKVVQVIKPLTRRDNMVTIVYDNDEVERVEARKQFEITQTKTIQ